jgi:hypothetical protein
MTRLDEPVNPVDVNVQFALSVSVPSRFPLESSTLMSHWTLREQPSETAGQGLPRFANVTV